jgi:putative endonuclease
VNTRARGLTVERQARSFLEARGYRLVQSNYTCKLGEIDIVADDAGTLCFIEVRSRSRADRGSPLETIDARKRRHIARAAQHYLVAHRATHRPARFDVVSVVGDRFELVRNAFYVE